jgi:hypothetical protein
MSRFCLLGFVLVLLVTNCASQPNIVISETTFDFGNLYQGETKMHTVKVYNNGTDTLKIAQLDAPCNCSIPSMDTDIILPNDSADLRITFDSKSFMGDVRKGVLVVSNDRNQRNLWVLFHVNIRPVIEFFPGTLVFFSADSARGTRRPLWIKNRWNKLLTIRSIEDPMGFVGGMLRDFQIQPGDSTAIEVSLLRPCASDTNGSVSMWTDCSFSKVFKVDYLIQSAN